MIEDGPNNCMIINRNSLRSRTVATATHNNLQILENDRLSAYSPGSRIKCRSPAILRVYSERMTFSKLSEKRLQSPTAESSEDTLEENAHTIPSLPSSLRLAPYVKESREIRRPVKEVESEQFLHVLEVLYRDDEFLMAAEIGDATRLTELIAKGADVHQKDALERNALHLAVCTGNMNAVLVLLKAGVNPRLKNKIGMSPLSLCLMRRPSWLMASVLFEYGAKLLPRNTPTDTGLFLQFVMMCEPTQEEAKILRLLVDKGALVNDPQAPGGRQALHFAAMSNNCELISILLDLGADLLCTNHRNETPKEVAATFKCRDAFRLLEERENLLECSP